MLGLTRQTFFRQQRAMDQLQLVLNRLFQILQPMARSPFPFQALRTLLDFNNTNSTLTGLFITWGNLHYCNATGRTYSVIHRVLYFRLAFHKGISFHENFLVLVLSIFEVQM
mmetsp:Transcript_24235/g.47661  ORF Transcript_24235/g.47661 Transcript_24235/m.47661 type:complete len:112 (+) Transcript_24235:817-1152(+)